MHVRDSPRNLFGSLNHRAQDAEMEGDAGAEPDEPVEGERDQEVCIAPAFHDAFCIMTDTGSTPFDVNNDPDLTSIAQRRNGIASLGAGVKRAEIRADVGYIVDSSERQGYVRLAKVLDGVAKTNHRGLLAEDAITPEILNSCFIDDTAGAPDGWTLVKSTGDIATSTDEPLFENIADWGQQVVKVTKGSGDT